ncbi:MAG TPA: CHASE3 domain-containing protein [Chitinophagaceae bacterium]|nr:CHASE3 domain-containing protein [Chitinophagaceae bacterium]
MLYLRITLLTGSFNQLAHANKIELSLEYVLSYLKDAETGQRGFLLTKDSTFLTPYNGARQRIDSALTEVEKLTTDNLTQQQNFISLQDLIDRRFALLDQAFQKIDEPYDSLRMNMNVGKSSMDRIRLQVEIMKHAEKDQLAKLENTKERYLLLTPVSLMFLVFATLLIVGFSYYGLTNQLQQTEKSAADLDRLNNELILKNKQLENSVDELNSFNYIASHDLKEPLRKILFFADAIAGHQTNLTPETKRNVEKIYNAGERMKSLLDDLLTYTQASMGERKIETVDLKKVLFVVMENLFELIKEKKAKIHSEDLPQLKAVPSQMEQLFENLISNALKYSHANVAPVITIKSGLVLKQDLPVSFEATHEMYHHIRFSDNGIGFTQDNAEKIFVLFQRLHQRNEFSGTGIGLTICKKIMQNHNGFIAASSEVNKGTTFTIYLPA